MSVLEPAQATPDLKTWVLLLYIILQLLDFVVERN